MKGQIDTCDDTFTRGETFHVHVIFTDTADRDAFVDGTDHVFRYVPDPPKKEPESWPRNENKPTKHGDRAAKIEFTPTLSVSFLYSLWLRLLRLVRLLVSTGTGTVHYTDSGGADQLTDASTKISEL
jgi:hypothetical protein